MRLLVVPTRWDLHVSIYIGLLSLLVACFTWWLWKHGAVDLLTALLFTLACVGVIIWCVRSVVVIGHAFARQARDLQRHPTLRGDKYRCRSGWVSDRFLLRRLVHNDGGPNDDATLVIYGLAPFIPHPAEYLHEPEIVSRRRPLAAILVLLASLVAAPWLLDNFALASTGARFLRVLIIGITGSLLLFVVIHLSVASRKYLRICPGLVEIIQQPLILGSPVVRSYPCCPGTAIILRMLFPNVNERRPGLIYGIRPLLSVMRGCQHDVFPLTRVDLNAVLQMLTSTRKTPPGFLPVHTLTG